MVLHQQRRMVLHRSAVMRFLVKQPVEKKEKEKRFSKLRERNLLRKESQVKDSKRRKSFVKK
ncbi:conserved hypothetical protein [Ricinus communis]|uniref:Uncharacterized protein n=1 Tax=Ricinus communis TaxID=3988 RepID=B9T0Y2_RICCO|nr:conserved hypothetical protein [Ricinus communis]